MSAETEEDRVRILIVDDQEANLLALEAVLSELGHSIDKARSGQEALSQILHRDYAVVLLDVRMPDMDGFETATYLRRRPRSSQTPIIFVTAVEDSLEHVAKGYSVGAVDYILKPVQPDVLKSKVKVFAELWEKTRALERKTQSLEREIVERRRVERELLAANQELESFSYSVSHDLRTPLRAMAGLSQALIEDYREKPLDDTGRDYAQRIIKASRQMDALIEDLLAFSRLGRERVLLVPVDLAALLSDVLSKLDLGKGRVGVEGALPQVQGNPVLLSQVLVNLLTNASKFVGAGVQPRITLRADSRGRKARVWVEDNGIGIAPEHHDRIFRVFERLNDSRIYPGTGIGLAIVRRAMEKMKGRAGVESEAGKGSRFWIELGLAGVPAETGPVPEPARDLERSDT